MADLGTTLIDNSQEVIDAMSQQVKNALWVIGATAEGHTKANCPVDTGRLRNSITFATSDQHSTGESPAEASDYATNADPEAGAVYVGTNVEYAPYIELGSSTRTAVHMIQDACQNHVEEYKSILEAALKS